MYDINKNVVNFFLSSAPRPQTLQPIKFREIVHKTRIIVENKTTKNQTKKDIVHHPMGQDNKTADTPNTCRTLNGPSQWTTSMESVSL